jgi:drug/metabolite transporter (DMT)-like permease
MLRALRDLGTPLGLKFSQLLFGAIALMPFAPFNILTVNPKIPVWALISGVISMLANLLVIMAYKLTPATRMAPFVYLKIINAAILGVFIFRYWPNGLSWFGMTVIIACCEYRQDHGPSPFRSALDDKWLIGRLT